MAPEADRVGMKVETAAGLDIGERGLFVEQQDQLGTLMGLVSHRPGRGEAAGLVEKLRRELRAVSRRGAGHRGRP
jgi:hypothetical protein